MCKTKTECTNQLGANGFGFLIHNNAHMYRNGKQCRDNENGKITVRLSRCKMCVCVCACVVDSCSLLYVCWFVIVYFQFTESMGHTHHDADSLTAAGVSVGSSVFAVVVERLPDLVAFPSVADVDASTSRKCLMRPTK